jgi:arylsulfatase A-like enzyme
MNKKYQLKSLLGPVLVAVLAALPCPVQGQPTRRPAPRLPSIIFILADDLGYGDLGCYGQTMIKTPNIDKLVAEGMKFTDFYAGDTVCAPSRCTLMTGLHTGHARIRSNGEIPLRPEDVTVAEVLKQAYVPNEKGYRTCAIGKWGLGELGSTGTPGKKGFDEWFGYLNQVAAHNYYPEILNRFDGSRPPGQQEKQLQITENLGGKKGKYSNDYFTEAALNYLGYSKPDWNNHYRPFFLYLPYTIPHANNELEKETGNGMEVPSDEPYSNEPWPQVEKNKAAMITRLDKYVGMIMEALKKAGMDKNTVVMFTSDNGAHKEGGVDPKFFHSNGPLRGIKRDLYEGGIRVPFIVWWPGHVKAGTTSDLPAAFWDFLPTAAELARTAAPANIDGISILPTLLGETQTNRHEFLYWEFHEGGFKQAVRMGNWKGIRYGLDGKLQLYNLKTDIGEKTDVAAANPEMVAKIEDYLKTARTADTNWPTATAAETSKLEYGAEKAAKQ